MIVKDGFTNYEQLVGVLMLDTTFQRLPADIGNARIFDFPIRYMTVRAADATKIMGGTPAAELLAGRALWRSAPQGRSQWATW